MRDASMDQLLLYTGCRTSQQRGACGKGIEVFQVKSPQQLQHLQCMKAGINPSFLCINRTKNTLYCLHGDEDQVSSFGIDSTGKLSPLNTICSGGSNPVHLALSPSGHYLLVANYASGNITSVSVHPDGTLGSVVCTLPLPATPGPHRQQQRGSHPHQIVFHPSGSWLAVPDKGCDVVHILTLDEHTGMLAWRNCHRFPAGSGPRHITFNRQGTLAWLVLELSSQVLAAQVHTETGAMSPVQLISTLPDDYFSDNTASGIVLMEDTHTLHVSNRGHGSVVRYSVDPITGKLLCPSWTLTGGKVPRFICQFPGTQSLIAANEDQHTLVLLDPCGKHRVLAQTGSPVCVIFQSRNPS